MQASAKISAHKYFVPNSCISKWQIHLTLLINLTHNHFSPTCWTHVKEIKFLVIYCTSYKVFEINHSNIYDVILPTGFSFTNKGDFF